MMQNWTFSALETAKKLCAIYSEAHVASDARPRLAF
jgi:hypothetical protein